MARVASPVDGYSAALCYLPPTACSMDCFQAEVKGKRRRTDSDISTACSVNSTQPFDLLSRAERYGSEMMPEDVPSEWNKSRVLALGNELLEGFNTEHFQAELKELRAKSSNRKTVSGLCELALTVQSEVLPYYGFDGTSEGVENMLECINPFLVDAEVNKMIREIDIALGMPVPDEPIGDVTLSRSQVLKLGGELLDGFRDAGFQEVLQSLLQSTEGESLALERMELAMCVQREVLPKYGFSGDQDGVAAMLKAAAPHATNLMVSSMMTSIDESLGVTGGTTLSSM